MNFPPHDRFCEYHGETMYGTRPCTCEYLARVRADEREQAVQRVGDAESSIVDRMFTSIRFRSSDWYDTVVAAIRGEQP
jgi:hypothetical protein